MAEPEKYQQIKTSVLQCDGVRILGVLYTPVDKIPEQGEPCIDCRDGTWGYADSVKGDYLAIRSTNTGCSSAEVGIHKKYVLKLIPNHTTKIISPIHGKK